jgi:protein-tyrosine-phosphatase
MEPKHARSILDLDQRLSDKIVRLWEYVDEDLDGIPDPVGQDIEAFRVARDRIEQGLEAWFDTLSDDG